MPKIDIRNFDYFMFVDASGDDGNKFDKDSSLCFTTACFITKTSDIHLNLNILNNIKAISGRQVKDELKYKNLRRHYDYGNAIKELKNLKGAVALHNSFKIDLFSDNPMGITFNDEFSKKNKLLTAFTHTFPVEVLNRRYSKSPYH